MRNRLVDNFDYPLLCLRGFRIQFFDAWQCPEDSAHDGQQKARQTKQIHDMADSTRWFRGTVSKWGRGANFAATPAESGRKLIVSVHPPILNKAG